MKKKTKTDLPCPGSSPWRYRSCPKTRLRAWSFYQWVFSRISAFYSFDESGFFNGEGIDWRLQFLFSFCELVRVFSEKWPFRKWKRPSQEESIWGTHHALRKGLVGTKKKRKKKRRDLAVNWGRTRKVNVISSIARSMDDWRRRGELRSCLLFPLLLLSLCCSVLLGQRKKTRKKEAQ